jgi:hypothetical protein
MDVEAPGSQKEAAILGHLSGSKSTVYSWQIYQSDASSSSEVATLDLLYPQSHTTANCCLYSTPSATSLKRR